MLDALRAEIRRHIRADEAEVLARLVETAGLSLGERSAISAHAETLVREVRSAGHPGVMQAFLGEYGLSTDEGIALMCLAEALLRVPDAETIDELIHDKITGHDWGEHIGDSASPMVNASTWALLLTGRVLDDAREPGLGTTLRHLVRRLGEPVIRVAVGRAMREMGSQFVLGRTIEEALSRGGEMVRRGYTYSFDMLGEAARTESDARRYHTAYADAIDKLAAVATHNDLRDNPGISVKLSALHPRYEFAQRETMMPVIASRLLELARAAMDAGIGLNVDAEESDRLEPSLDVIERALRDPSLAGWDGFGVVVQAYGQRAAPVIDWLVALAEALDRRLMVRLVKGAYWDTEIKRAQVMGLDGYPVFTRKPNTDVSYIACARKLLARTDRLYPQFATHNAHTAAAVLAMAGEDRKAFEFQRLHGMGEALHDVLMEEAGTRCRIYAPVGAHRDLLAYLVRRLLENGANSSFVHQIVDDDVAPATIAADPFAEVIGDEPVRNPAIPDPAAIFGADRRNARGWDITDPATVAWIERARAPFAAPHRWEAAPITGAAGSQDAGTGAAREVVNPANPREIVGWVREASAEQAAAAVSLAAGAQRGWAATPVTERGAILRRIADLYEANAPEFFALAAREAGKTLLDGVAEVREAVDFLCYYALMAETAEAGTEARGVIVCISPWNFPLAIFTGQIAAALAAGNAVVAKPAEQTPLIAARAVALMHEAGVPADVLHLLPGDGPSVGAPLIARPEVAGVCFTGSTEVARLIERRLAESGRPDAMLIAETGGLNAMIVDSTALPEQAVRDILASAFQSAGQRCSALRILYLQRDIADRFLDMLFGAMDALAIGDPWSLATDVGPVIDRDARTSIEDYCRAQEAAGRLMKRTSRPLARGRFVAPTALRSAGIAQLEREVFGPVLHVAEFEAETIDAVVEAINARGYGLTMGLHTRIDSRVQEVIDGAHVGNLYVNRNQIGAVVGSQPFGGEGLSGTGPKAGGPHYVRRFRKSTARGDTAAAPLASGDPAVHDAVVAALAKLSSGAWATRADRTALLAEAARRSAPLGGAGALVEAALQAVACIAWGTLDLPGPTGEANRIRLVPRGPALCLGPTADVVAAQVIQALAAGCPTVAVLARPAAAHTGVGDMGTIAAMFSAFAAAGAPLVHVVGTLDPHSLARLPVAVVALVGDGVEPDRYLRACRRALAERDGPIVPVVSEVLQPAAFAHERAVCIDTTAAGGNASLLASS